MNHLDSLQRENKLYETTKEKMEEMQKHDMTWIEVKIFIHTSEFSFQVCQ